MRDHVRALIQDVKRREEQTNLAAEAVRLARLAAAVHIVEASRCTDAAQLDDARRELEAVR